MVCPKSLIAGSMAALRQPCSPSGIIHLRRFGILAPHHPLHSPLVSSPRLLHQVSCAILSKSCPSPTLVWRLLNTSSSFHSKTSRMTIHLSFQCSTLRMRKRIITPNFSRDLIFDRTFPSSPAEANSWFRVECHGSTLQQDIQVWDQILQKITQFRSPSQDELV